MGQRIEINKLSKTFQMEQGSLAVLDDLSFSVADNEFVVVVGPSGCGKTTLLKLISGTIDPTSGDIFLDDIPVTDPPESVAMVFQDFVLLPWKTVLQNVAVGLKIQNDEPPESRKETARHWIEKVGLDGFEDSYPNELSGGMKQRVGLARALAVDPEVLLMDEPFGSLDAQTKDELQTELLALWESEQKTVLFVTHDIDEAIYMADRILVISETPATIKAEFDVNIERPRWRKRHQIEQSDEFARLKKQLREELNLFVAESSSEDDL